MPFIVCVALCPELFLVVLFCVVHVFDVYLCVFLRYYYCHREKSHLHFDDDDDNNNNNNNNNTSSVV
jgi:hypothetical protein